MSREQKLELLVSLLIEHYNEDCNSDKRYREGIVN